ncbi:hypothetical protein [Cellulosimicrobium protaetiae]|uniref:Uncharacterized protein n=1 Tax=Cellulosimicrobium protaetiae TaxID=2587808 RepID=A0A6M5UFK3_9MICO|nr:hypothetical protein [Cellulosimicrobium protaetiae]QJW36834.1 hypothetical protein FIC82_012180 [Cellulosimicrobium protaetiae]
MVPGRRPTLTGAVLVLVAALAACSDGGSTATARWHVAPDADLAGDVLPIVVEHGASCEEYGGVDVVESDDTVEITVRVVAQDPREGAVCPEAAIARRVDVPLDAPLGERRVRGPGLEQTPDLG